LFIATKLIIAVGCHVGKRERKKVETERKKRGEEKKKSGINRIKTPLGAEFEKLAN
jgi:hypothetical protein